MADFGTDVGNSTLSGALSLTGKLLEALLKLIAKIFDTFMEKTSAEHKLKKAEYHEVKENIKQKKFEEIIDGKVGFVNHKDLVKAGVPLTVTQISMEDKDFKELAGRCKRVGIVISGVEDIRASELTGKKARILECKQSDLPRLKELIDLMNDEKKITVIQEEIDKTGGRNQELAAQIDSIKSSGSELTPEELNKIKDLETEIEENNNVMNELDKQVWEIRQGHSQDLNTEQAQGVCEKAVNGETLRGVDFNEAVDRWTGGKIDKDTTCYVIDAKDPNRYIVCNAKNDVFRKQEYIRTTYEVYNAGKQVYATNDRRFDGRQKDYWVKEKAAMRAAGGFSDQVIKFYSLKELEAYRENYKAQNAAEIDGLGVGKEGRDYEGIIKNLEAKINECGGAYRDSVLIDKETGKQTLLPGVVINNETGKPMLLKEGMGTAERTTVAEAVVMGKQIANYKEISQLEREVAIARTNVLTANEGKPEHIVAQAEFEKVENAYKTAIDTEAVLIDERKSINAVQAEQEVHNSPNNILEAEKDDSSRDNGSLDDRQNESSDDIRHAMKMEEYKDEIADRRKESGVKGNDVKVSEMTKEKAVPQGKGDR